MNDTAVRTLHGYEFSPRGRSPLALEVPVEFALLVEVNGRPVATLMALPGLERELAVGFCLSEGIIASFADILLVHHCRDEAGNMAGVGAVVRLRAREEAVARPDLGTALVLSGCGGMGVDLAALSLPPLPAPARPLVSAQALASMARALRRLPGAYRRAGGVHAAALFAADGEMLIAAEDVGRHNAVDKVLGAAAMRGLALQDKALLSTGRASHELVTKALRLRVPVVGSFSSVTSLAVELAEQGGCTLIGRLRGERFLVYAWSERIA